MDEKNLGSDNDDRKRKVVLGEEDYPSSAGYKNTDNEGGNYKGQDNNPAPEEAEEIIRKDPNELPEENEEDDSLLSHLIRRNRGRNREVFDEERDRELAEEMTKDIPPGVIEKKTYRGNYSGDEYERKAIGHTPSEDEGMDEDGVIISDAEYIEHPKVHKSYKDLTDREKRDVRVKRRITGLIIGAVITGILFWTIPMIQKAVFMTKGNTLVFIPQTGFWGPRMGIVDIVIGIAGIILLIYSFLGSRRETPLRAKKVVSRRTVILRRLSVIMALFLPLGITNLFNFSEFRNTDVRFSSIFNTNDLKDYNNASQQEVALIGNDILYRITLGNKKTHFAINQQPVEVVKTIDNLMNKGRTVAIDSQTFQEIIRRGIYTEKQAYEVFKYKAQ